MKTVQLLLAEDDDLDAEALERAMAAAEVTSPIHRVADGEEALARLRATGDDALPRPVLVLLDLNMPLMTGHEFLRELRTDPDPDLRRTVVFVVTTSSDERDIRAAYDEHVAGYVTKSSTGNDFFPLISMLRSYWEVVELP